MAITQAQYQAAGTAQHAAAHDVSPQVRLVAGPGTGKSFSIGERVHWLLQRGIPASRIYAVSFTNAATTELADGIAGYLTNAGGYSTPPRIHVSTLHSLALSALTRAGQLAMYPVNPHMLDKWSQRFLYDEELANVLGCTRTRASEIRIHQESVWNTGAAPAPFISSPNAPVTPSDLANFTAFHNSRSNLFACLLPGESIRRCLTLMQSGLLNPVAVLGIGALIVDEFQDLNPCDQQLIDLMARAGVSVFVAGDDDQSIYAFRYASPAGIQSFQNRYPQSASHTLQVCFRCTGGILSAATNVITSHAAPGRLSKNLASAYSFSVPPESGVLHTWSFAGETSEARGIAESCNELISAGISAEDILILLTQRGLGGRIEQELQAYGIQFLGLGTGAIADTNAGRFVASLLRVIGDPDFLVGYRTILALLSRVGTRTCRNVSDECLNNNARYADIFRNAVPPWLAGASLSAINRVRNCLSQVNGWQLSDIFAARAAAVLQLVSSNLTAKELIEWQTIAAALPPSSTLSDVLAYLEAANNGERQDIIARIVTGTTTPTAGLTTTQVTAAASGVRLMTLHSSKGLSARVVFIPGLEESCLPSSQDMLFPGLLLQAARLLYVGMTRARAGLILSFARSRPQYVTRGPRQNRTPSRFLGSIGQQFVNKSSGLSATEAMAISSAIGNL